MRGNQGNVYEPGLCDVPSHSFHLDQSMELRYRECSYDWQVVLISLSPFACDDDHKFDKSNEPEVCSSDVPTLNILQIFALSIIETKTVGGFAD